MTHYMLHLQGKAALMGNGSLVSRTCSLEMISYKAERRPFSQMSKVF